VAVTRYPVPAGICRVEDEARHSRFITTLTRAGTIADAQAFIQSVRDEFPDATHHCWAYVVGPPGSTAQVGMSDDGEPHGTAGRPMLSTLLHSAVGDVVAVVTRYYGGTNLGTGGLVRAYGGGVVHALGQVPRTERVELMALNISLDYAHVSAFEQLLPGFEVRVSSRRFESEVTFDVQLPDTQRDGFRQAVLDLTRGQARIADGG
jgi:uncharacterized YigZ family protein